MVARTDLRPTRADDSLKKLLGKVTNPQTVPHGVKVARPGEYVDFYATDGVSHRWDGDAIAEYDNRIAEGAEAVAAAQAHLAEVEADLAEAKERITASNGDLTLYVQRVEAAQATADAANAALQNLTQELQTAQSAVDAVVARTGAVESALADTDSKAVQAANTANEAANAAQDALAASQQVQADAQNALSKAEEAEAKALEAAGIAAGKGKIIYSASEPSGAEASTSNLWIRSSDSKPHRWDGSAWVAVTDKAIVDAAAAAASAQSAANTAKATADKAVADAAQAAQSAQAASIAAGNAQRTADGKTVALFGTATPPPAPGVTQGDLYYRIGNDSRIMEHWQWSGSVWVKRAIESAQLVNFDAGYITSGYLDVAKRIRAGDIHAEKLFVGVGTNLMPPLSMTADYGGEHPNRVLNATGGYTGGVSITVPAGTSQMGAYASGTTSGDYLIKVNPGGEYHVSAWVKPGTKVGQPTIYVRFVDSTTGTWSWATPSNVTGTNLTAGAWGNISGTVTAQPGTTYDRMVIGFFANGDHDATVFSDPVVREKTDGSLIVNGSITGEKVNAESVAAAVGSFVKVNAENVTVTGELAARVVNAMTAQVKNLVVTESAILQHTTLLGETVAEQLNVTKKLVARDAIVNGTLDVAQLNVTEAMSAKIVSAMSLESKKLVVTEDAILNRATVVQSLVTPELIADRINVNSLGAQLVTSGAIQTDTATDRGIKISNAGIIGYSADGKQTININGSTNRIVGEFSTGEYGQPRVNIYNKFNPIWGTDESIIDLQASGMSGVSSYDNAVTRLTSSAREGFSISTGGNKRLVLDSYGAAILADKISLDGNVGVGGKLSPNKGFGNSNGFRAVSGGPYSIGPNTYQDVTVRFPNIGSRPYIIPTMSFDNAGDISLSVWNVTTSAARVRLYNSGTNTVSGIYLDTIIVHIER